MVRRINQRIYHIFAINYFALIYYYVLILIFFNISYYNYIIVQSHPSRVRGLKFTYNNAIYKITVVAPYVGVWLEISKHVIVECKFPNNYFCCFINFFYINNKNLNAVTISIGKSGDV